MKSYLVLAVICLFTSNGFAEEKIRISYFQAQPHIIFDSENKEVSGALFTFLETYIAPEMGVRFLWDSVPSNIPRQIQMLKSGSRDAMAILQYSPERAGKFSYPKHPFYTSKSTIGVLAASSLKKIERVEDILSLEIGYVARTYLSPFMQDRRIRFDFITSALNPNEMNLKKLKAGRIDAIYIPDKAALLSGMKHLNIEDLVRCIDLPELPGKTQVVFSKSRKDLARAFDRAFEKVGGDTVYKSLLSQYLDVSQL